MKKRSSLAHPWASALPIVSSTLLLETGNLRQSSFRNFSLGVSMVTSMLHRRTLSAIIWK